MAEGGGEEEEGAGSWGVRSREVRRMAGSGGGSGGRVGEGAEEAEGGSDGGSGWMRKARAVPLAERCQWRRQWAGAEP